MAKSRFVDKMTFRFADFLIRRLSDSPTFLFVRINELELNGNRSIFRCQVGRATSFAAVGSNPNSGDRFVLVKSPLKYT